ncbi:MAG: GrpB family protein [Lewinella sp.]
MRPPICTICNQRFSPSAADAGLIYFAESDSDKAFNERFKQRRLVGHKRGQEWFCATHYADALANKHLTAAAYKKLVKSRFRLIQPYTEDWVKAFVEISEVLEMATKGLGVIVHHVGSTAVPGLGAKPIIDIDIELPETEAFAAVTTALEGLEYTHVGDYGIPKRETFKRKGWHKDHPVLDRISHHLYVCPPDSPELRRHLAFRNYLREHAWAREEYEAIKQEIASITKQNKKAYAELKETRARAFVERILDKAG